MLILLLETPMLFRMARPKGPDKRAVLIRLLESTAIKLEQRADAKGESLPAYIAANLEQLAKKR